MKKDEPFDPIYLGLFSTFAVMPGANRLPHLIEKLRFGGARFSRSLVAVDRYTRSAMLHDGAPLTGATIHRGHFTSKGKQAKNKLQSRGRFAVEQG